MYLSYTSMSIHEVEYIIIHGQKKFRNICVLTLTAHPKTNLIVETELNLDQSSFKVADRWHKC